MTAAKSTYVKQRISIVFEDTGEDGGHGFNVYLEGHTRNFFKIKEEDRSGAEFWAARSMEIVVSVLKEAGVVKAEGPIRDVDSETRH